MSNQVDEDAVAQLKELMGDKYAQLVETYLRSGGDHVAKLKAGFESGDVQAIVDSAHPLKSASGNMGLMGLSSASTQLEGRANDVVDGNGDVASLKELVDSVDALFASGEAFLKTQI